jgi:alpha-L-rhamnosidase
MKTYVGFLLIFLMMIISTIVVGQFDLTKLKTNYQTTPLGIDIAKPQFSWQMVSTDTQKGRKQIAYQIKVENEDGKTVWNSNKISNDLSHGIQYQGDPIQPTTRYNWEIIVWDNFKKINKASSWFETGLLNPTIDAWSGAKWIGGGDEDLVLYSPFLGVFKIEYDIQLDSLSQSTKASFVFGANDPRLANKHLNLMAQENKKNDGYIAVELDISSVHDHNNGLAKLNIYRVGYTKEDSKDIPFKSLSIPQSIINSSNKYEKHRIFISNKDFTIFEFHIDKLDASNSITDKSLLPSPENDQVGLNLNPIGAGHNYITFPMLAEIGFKTEVRQKAFFSNLEIKNLRHPSNKLFYENLNQFQTIFKDKSIDIIDNRYVVNENTFCTADPSRNAAPMLRTEFTNSNKKIKKARIYFTARGVYEIFLNGKKLGNNYFNPGLTQYNKNHMYHTHDVTNEIINGKNAIGAWLSEGWWSGNNTYKGQNWNYFGDRQSLLMKLVINYTDGTEKVITSNDKVWKIFTDGPIKYGSFFQGEVYDATKENLINGWTNPEYDDAHWKKTRIVALSGNTYTGDDKKLNFNDLKIVSHLGENVSHVMTLNAISVKEVKPKVFVYDMGQNMVGIPRIKISNGKKGQKINLRFAEVIYPNLPAYNGYEGMVMMENIRAALATDIYILKGGDEYIQPRFTFHGYRYLEMTGVDSAPTIEDVKGLVLSSVHELTSKYESSDTLVNKLWENITWSLRSNFLSIPTDCPNRNERMGWGGDISVFSRSASYMTDANLFLKKHLLGMRDLQFDNGRFTDVSPVGGGFGGILWGSAGIILAWESYRQYGDIQLVAEHYPSMKKYVDFLQTKIDKETGILNEGPLGDWLSPEGNKNDNSLFWMSFYAYDLEIVGAFASIIGNKKDAHIYKNKALEVKKIFNKIYVDEVNHKTIKSGLKTDFMGAPNQNDTRTNSEKGKLMDTQASYAIPLANNTFNIENKNFAIGHLRSAIERRNIDDSGLRLPNYSLMTGFIGTSAINHALSENGADDLAYKLLTNKQYPSWLYSVVNGATSIWERLDSYTIEKGFGDNNSMNSFNHYSFGAVAAWMVQNSLGIQRHPTIHAFKEFILDPSIDPNNSIQYAKGHYESMYGTIKSEWKIVGNTKIINISIPANTSAKIHLPTSSFEKIKSDGKKIKTWKNSELKNNKIILPLRSGIYSFTIEK